MNKYYRTEDGRILELDERTVGTELPATIGEPTEFSCVYQGVKIVEVADTIEELCDCYVMLLKNKEHHIFHYHTLMCRIMDEAKEQVDAIYGAIWTDKGLIYVAKMNDKGELELL